VEEEEEEEELFKSPAMAPRDAGLVFLLLHAPLVPLLHEESFAVHLHL